MTAASFSIPPESASSAISARTCRARRSVRSRTRSCIGCEKTAATAFLANNAFRSTDMGDFSNITDADWREMHYWWNREDELIRLGILPLDAAEPHADGSSPLSRTQIHGYGYGSEEREFQCVPCGWTWTGFTNRKGTPNNWTNYCPACAATEDIWETNYINLFRWRCNVETCRLGWDGNGTSKCPKCYPHPERQAVKLSVGRFGQYLLTRRILIDIRFTGDEYTCEAEDATLNLHGAGTYTSWNPLMAAIDKSFHLLWTKVALVDDSKLIPESRITKRSLLPLVAKVR